MEAMSENDKETASCGYMMALVIGPWVLGAALYYFWWVGRVMGLLK